MNNKEIQSLILKLHPDRPGGNLKKFLELRKKLEEQAKSKNAKSAISIDLTKFESEYKNSPEEVDDLVLLYNKHRGRLDKIIKDHLFATGNDESRIRDILEHEIQSQRLKRWKALSDNTKKRSKNKNSKTCIKKKKEIPEFLELSGMKKYDDLLDNLEKKYK